MSRARGNHYDLCIVGHVTDDFVIAADGLTCRQLGGVPTYAQHLFAAAGLRTAVITRASPGALERVQSETGGQVAYFSTVDVTTTTFVNSYDEDSAERVQYVLSQAGCIGPDALDGIKADVWYFGPLLANDIAPETYRLAAQHGSIALDLQGLCRTLTDSLVTASAAPQIPDVVGCAEVVKASREEARTTTGCQTIDGAIAHLMRLGAAEVLITDAANGLWLGTCAGVHHVPAAAAAHVVDSTGCGDTLLTAYLLMRQLGASPAAAARIGADAAAEKAGQRGPLRRLTTAVATAISAATVAELG